ncbi:hypothetical protein EJ05DRAFT_245910 [Pseudovirgaria hyperparasitica]|uniref:Uncharacterized protein n=1 Tax=Pseudovirgaria hyperparasitica TaxID=470096 RepID=A0A6A6WGX8_9PEZI|nr:uncharacterized protein EJ05DRAFT_245910 [Pseudovirgaria hyperparasitica]KAF2760897.1 hypothetical protein EJ05DRAFT_245910 [Pseudovirgaria hyperparasitica]
MCRSIRYIAPCHAWLVFTRPCAPGRNLMTCPAFQDGATTVIPSLPVYEYTRHVPRHQCPLCGHRRGLYDMGIERIIKNESKGARFGAGPTKRGVGVEIYCCMMLYLALLYRSYHYFVSQAPQNLESRAFVHQI